MPVHLSPSLNQYWMIRVQTTLGYSFPWYKSEGDLKLHQHQSEQTRVKCKSSLTCITLYFLICFSCSVFQSQFLVFTKNMLKYFSFVLASFSYRAILVRRLSTSKHNSLQVGFCCLFVFFFILRGLFSVCVFNCKRENETFYGLTLNWCWLKLVLWFSLLNSELSNPGQWRVYLFSYLYFLVVLYVFVIVLNKAI